MVRDRAGRRLAISSGLWWLSPRVGWYVGASGVLHSVMAAGAARHLLERAWDRWILMLGLCAKLAWEQWGASTSTRWSSSMRILYGAACGFVVGRCTVLEDRYNSPPFSRPLEALRSCHLHSFFPVKARSPSA